MICACLYAVSAVCQCQSFEEDDVHCQMRQHMSAVAALYRGTHRPISNLPVLSKLLERSVGKHCSSWRIRWKMIYSQFSSQVHVGVLIRGASIRRRWSYRPHDACTTLGDRAFQVTAARAWNALPSSVRSAPSLLQFRRDLKTALHVSVVVLFAIVSSCVTDCNF